MEIDDFTSNGFVRRWTLPLDAAGQARCPDDAIPPAAPGALLALQRNKAVRDMIAAVERYEEALRVLAAGLPSNGEPIEIPDPEWIDPEDGSSAPMIENPAWALAPREISTTDENGETVVSEDPRWTVWDAAAVIERGNRGTWVAALATWRAGGSEEEIEAARATALAELETRAAQPLPHDPRPVPEEISRRQFAYGAVAKGFMSQNEALRFVNAGTLPDQVEAVLVGASLSGDVQFAARMALASNTFRRHHPTTLQFLPLLGIEPADADSVWRIGGSIP